MKSTQRVVAPLINDHDDYASFLFNLYEGFQLKRTTFAVTVTHDALSLSILGAMYSSAFDYVGVILTGLKICQ